METGKNARTTAFVAAVAVLVALLVALPGAARADGSSFAAANAAAGSSSLPAGTPDSTCGVTCEGGSDPEWYPNFGTTDSVTDTAPGPAVARVRRGEAVPRPRAVQAGIRHRVGRPEGGVPLGIRSTLAGNPTSRGGGGPPDWRRPLR